MPAVVVDIGNSRIKFCRCDKHGLQLPVRGVTADDLDRWNALAEEWQLGSGAIWAIASTSAPRRDQFVRWLDARGDKALLINWRDVPIDVALDEPERVGIDRILNGFAAAGRVKPGHPAIVADAGSAVTVDLVDEKGRFAGGSIFPGLRLMALSLHEHTAALPLVDTTESLPTAPGTDTDSALRLGIAHAVAGGIDSLVRALAAQCTVAPRLFLTGGDMTPALAGLLETRKLFQSELLPALTLEGIHRAATSS